MIALDGALDRIAAIEAERHPRWVTWSQADALELVRGGVRLTRCWDVAAAHRLLFGGWRAEPALAWARAHDLPTSGIPGPRPHDLFHQADDSDDAPVRADGYLTAEWDAVEPGTRARLAVEAATRQEAMFAALPDPERALATARVESAAELLCAELTVDGLPVDRAAAEASIAAFIGPRPRDEREAAERRAERDAAVLAHAPGTEVDLRSPGQVKSLLRRVGIEVPDTRAWRLEAMRDQHPLVDALLVWRKAERVATTYGYGWLDTYVGDDGRLRGEWSAADGAAGRMTASAGLHNLPGDLRTAVRAGDGWRFVRADLGQIEPRILAAVSGDAALAAATRDDDMYRPVAAQLGVDRATAKVAVLGAMYGQTTGHGAQALHRLQTAYPVAIAYLEEASAQAQGAHDLRTFGGRLVRMSSANANEVSDRDLRSHAAARGRYGRNAMVQGAAAEFFKLWAVTVRARAATLGARIVLCLHDELLVHAPAETADDVAALVDECLQEAAHRWAPAQPPVRFLADTAVIDCWADAKG
ncbi:MAG: DNA polymerase [Acidimicrobiales bacterium]